MKIVYMKRRKDTPRVKRANQFDPVDAFTDRLIISDIKKLYRKNRARLDQLEISEVEFFKQMKDLLL